MSEMTTEYLLRFPGFSRQDSVCHLFLSKDGAVLGELEDNKGTSLTNALEIACGGVAQAFFNGRTDFAVFEWIPRDVLTGDGRMLEIKWHADGFRLPEWVRVLRLPPWAAAAEASIRGYTSYTSFAVHMRGVPELKIDHTPLEQLRRDLPSLPAVSDRPPRPPAPRLTESELDVLKALARPFVRAPEGAMPSSDRAIAAQLSISPDAVQVHVRRLYKKLDIDKLPEDARRVQLVHDATERGVITRRELLDDADG